VKCERALLPAGQRRDEDNERSRERSGEDARSGKTLAAAGDRARGS
jgi:hypothetical protein